MTNEELLIKLRDMIINSEEALEVISREAGQNKDIEAWDTSRLIQGEILGYRRVIKLIRNLSEREFQIAIRKHTL